MIRWLVGSFVLLYPDLFANSGNPLSLGFSQETGLRIHESHRFSL